MATMVLERNTLPEPLLSYFAVPRIAVLPPSSGGEVILSPIIDPADYPDTTAYLNAIPGMAESILEASDFKPAPPESFRV